MNSLKPEPRMRLSRALNDLARSWPTLVAAQYSKSGGGSANTKVQTSGHSDAGAQWRPVVTQVVDDLRDMASYLGRLLDGLGAVKDWTDDVSLALQIAARPRQSRLLVEHPVVTDVLDEALTLRARAQRALNTTALPQRGLGATCLCEVVTDNEDGTTSEGICGAELTAVFDGPRSRILCKAHPYDHAVPVTAWDKFLRDVEAANA